MIIKPNLLAQLFYYVGSYQLILEEGQIKRDLKTLWFFKRKPKFLNANKIVVFDTETTLFGRKLTAGYKAGGGDDNTLTTTGLGAGDITNIQNYITEKGAQILQTDGETIKTSFPLFSPSRWLSYREKIIISSEGIGHVRKGWFKTRQSFLPYDSINMYCYDGVVKKDILLLGDTTINLNEKISNSDNSKIKKILEEKGITSTKGRKYLPAILSFKRGISPDALITTEKGILFKTKKLIGGQNNTFLRYEEITEFKKLGWLKLFAPILIKGTRVDARVGEGSEVEFQLNGVAFYRWCTLLFFKGSLKSTLKSRCS